MYNSWGNCVEWSKKEIQNNPSATSQTLEASQSMLNVKVHGSKNKTRWNKYSLFGMGFLSTKKMKARLGFTKLHLNKPQDLWNNVLWIDDVRGSREAVIPSTMFGKNQTSFQQKHNIRTVLCFGACFVAWAGIVWTMNSSLYQRILMANLSSRVV